MNHVKENSSSERKCVICKIMKPLTREYFYYEKSRQYGLAYKCIACEKEGAQEKHFKRYYGHYDKERDRSKKYYWGEAHLTCKHSNYRQQDKKRGWDNDLTIEYMRTVFPTKCSYCGVNVVCGLDRIDNDKPHNIDNVVPCCKECNVVRGNRFSCEEMKILGKTVKRILIARKK